MTFLGELMLRLPLSTLEIGNEIMNKCKPQVKQTRQERIGITRNNK